jgi:galactokinase
VVEAIAQKHPEVKYLRDADLMMLEEVKETVSAEDYQRAEFVIEEIQRLLDTCEALKSDDYETVGRKMYETHEGLSKKYEVSCSELDFLNDQAKKYGVTGSRVMGGGFGGCTINLVEEDKADEFIHKASEAYEKAFGIRPKVYDVVIKDGARKLS